MNEDNIITTNNDYPDKDGFSGKLVLKYVLKKKYQIAIITIIAAIASVIYALLLPNWYGASVNAVPPKSSGSSLDAMLGGVSSSLKELGLSKLTGGKSGGDQYSFLVILESRVLLDSMIIKYNLKEAYFPDDTDNEIVFSDVRKEFSKNLSVAQLDEGNYVISIIDKDSTRVAKMVMDFITMANNLAQRVYQDETNFNRKYLELRLKNLDSLLNETSIDLANYSKATGIISPEAQSKAFIEAISNMKYEIYTQELMYETIKNKYGENDQNTLNQLNILNKLKSNLKDAENKPGFVGNFTKSTAGEKGINFLKKSAEFEALTKLKLYLQPMLEEAKINESRNISTLTIIDPPITPDKKTKPKRSLIVAGITLGAFLLSILVVIGIFRYKLFKAELNK